MTSDSRPCRSVLYIPASNERALEKAKSIPTDAIIFDLEDAVAPAEKDNARSRLAAVIAAGGYDGRIRLVRINGFDTPWGQGDLEAFAASPPDGILMPKVSGGDHAADLAHRMDKLSGYSTTNTWAMIESPEGVLNAAEIARAPRMAGFVLGTNDLVKDLGATPDSERSQIQTALQMSLLAARGAGIIAIDGVYNAFRDEEGLVRECAQGRALGFHGKSLIHPSQVAPTNTAFSPTDDEVDLARRQIDAFEAAEAKGQGVAVLDGKIVENLHVATARQILAIDSAIRDGVS